MWGVSVSSGLRSASFRSRPPPAYAQERFHGYLLQIPRSRYCAPPAGPGGRAATAGRSCSSRVVVHGLLCGSAVLSRSWALVLIQGFRSCPRPAHQLCLAEEICDGHSQPGPRMHPPRHRQRPWLLAWLVVFCLAVFRFCGWPLCGVPFSWVFEISFPCCLPSSLGVIFVSGRTLCAHGFAPRTQVSWIDGDRVRPSSCLNFFGCGLPFRPSSLSTFSSFEPTSLARRISTSGV